jgi:hypothetical protein
VNLVQYFENVRLVRFSGVTALFTDLLLFTLGGLLTGFLRNCLFSGGHVDHKNLKSTEKTEKTEKMTTVTLMASTDTGSI